MKHLTALFSCLVLSVTLFGQTEFMEEIIISEDFDGLITFYVFDVDLDEDLDIVTGSEGDHHIYLFVNDGEGGFSNKKLLADNVQSPTSMIATFLDAGGFPDLVVGSSGLGAKEFGNGVFALKNLGNGDFDAPVIVNNQFGPVHWVWSAMVNPDPFFDVIAVHNLGIDWLKNPSNSIGIPFEDFDVSSSFGTTCSRYGDLNDNGLNDVIYNTSGGIEYRESSDGFYGFPKKILDGVGGIQYFTRAYLDNDLHQDLLIADVNNDQLLALFNSGDDNYKEEKIGGSFVGINWVVSKDIDGDMRDDILVSCAKDNKFYLLINQGSSTFSSEKFIPNNLSDPRKTDLQDLDGDGLNDIVAISHDDNKLIWYKNNSMETSISTPILQTSYVSLSPNPAKEEIRISVKANTSKPIRFNIISSSNSILKSGTLSSNENVSFDISYLANGMYFVQFANEDFGSQIEKLIKL